jgi:hypothetical protein
MPVSVIIVALSYFCENHTAKINPADYVCVKFVGYYLKISLLRYVFIVDTHISRIIYRHVCEVVSPFVVPHTLVGNVLFLVFRDVST